jgi:hypothetical protein
MLFGYDKNIQDTKPTISAVYVYPVDKAYL